MSTPSIIAAAWADRCDAAVATLQHAESAPGLFRPEYVEQLRDEANRANQQHRFWIVRASGTRGQR